MNRIKFSAALVLAFYIPGAMAQTGDDPVLMKIAGKPVTVSEFQSIYKKNNPSAEASSAENKSVDEYVSLFVNFKLKVKEAEELGLDTSRQFRDELTGYRKQLTQPYLIDKNLNDDLIREAYDRMQSDVKASHILVKLSPEASPKDTLLAYNKIMKIRKRVTGGENFEKVLGEIAKADKEIIAEDLGYFTAFQMVYPFETAAYNTKTGEISDPVRTKFGYHIVKVYDKRPARGLIRVAHIMVRVPDNASEEQKQGAKNKIDSVYKKLSDGEDFAGLAKTASDDAGSAKKGGALPWFGVGPQGVDAGFEDAAFGLKNDNEFSKPVQSKYGWHIIKRLEHKGTGNYDEAKAEIKSKIARDGRGNKTRESLVRKLKEEYGFSPDMARLADFYKVIDSSYFMGEWNIEKAKGLEKPLFVLSDTKYSKKAQEYSQKDFARFLDNNKRRQDKVDIKLFTGNMFEKFAEEEIIRFEESILEAKYPEFRILLQEYRDGILLFDLMDKKVWSRAVNDTAGLKDYYEKNKNHFMWDERLDAVIYTCSHAEAAKKTRELLKKQEKKKMSDEDLLSEINKDSTARLTIKAEKFLKGDNETIDKIQWTPGITENMTINGQVVFIKVNGIVAPEPKTLKEARGLVTAEYQKSLEEEWIKNLQEKYPVEMNRDILSKIK